MIGIEELSARVTEAERRFGLIGEEHAKYSARLISLLDTVQGRLREQEAEVEQQTEANARLQGERDVARGENEQLRHMLHSLLRAVENGGRDQVMQTMQALETRVSGLVAGDVPETETGEPAEVPEAETPAVTAEDDGAPEAASQAADDEPAGLALEPEEEVVEEPAANEAATEMPDEAPEDEGAPGEVPVSLAAIMQRVSHLANADDDAASAGDDDMSDSPEPGVHDLLGEAADDPADVNDQAAAATGT